MENARMVVVDNHLQQGGHKAKIAIHLELHTIVISISISYEDNKTVTLKSKYPIQITHSHFFP